MTKKEIKKVIETKKKIINQEEKISIPIEIPKKEVIMPKENKNLVSEVKIENQNTIKPIIKNDKENLDYKNKAEALLFSAGKKLEFDFIAQTINVKDKLELKNALIELKKDYDNKNSSLMIMEDNNSWKIVVREKYISIARKVNSEMELSKTIMETLAVIAWKTPILQSEVIRIRTNKAYDHIEELINSGFVTKEKKGRSFILKISQKFYDYFDVEGKDDIRKVFSKIKEEPGQKKVDEFESKKNEPNSPQRTLGDLKIVNSIPDESVKHAEAEMDKIRYGKLEVYDENNSNSKNEEKKVEISEKDDVIEHLADNIKKENMKEVLEQESIEKKTKDLVKKLLEDDKIEDKKK